MRPSLDLLPLTLREAETITAWRYAPPYDIYNVVGDGKEQARRVIRDDQSRFYSIRDGEELIGFCSFGSDGQVPGGPYDTPATDIGMGIKPELTGQGQGHLYARAVVDFARGEVSAGALRVTIARFNIRAQRVWKRTGFSQIAEFCRSDGLEFVILQLEADGT